MGQKRHTESQSKENPRYIRILVDGYNLLHAWPDLAKDYARHSEEAREELIYHLQQFQDQSGIPVSLIFDGNRSKSTKNKRDKGQNHAIEVLYSPKGLSADNVIERVACRLKDFGPVLVVTNDSLEKSMVTSFGATTMSCSFFIQDVLRHQTDLQERIHFYNRKENNNFRR